MDSSFTYDESRPQSTPHRKRLLESAFNKLGKISLDISADVSFENLTFAEGPSASCSDDNLKRRRKLNFQIPKVPPKKIKSTFVCTYCGRGYVSSAAYKTHTLNHKFQNAASQYPNKVNILNHVEDICEKALAGVLVAPCAGERAVLFKKLCSDVKLSSENWNQFIVAVVTQLLDSVIGEKFVLPSKLIGILVNQVENTLSSPENQDFLLHMLQLPVCYDCDNYGGINN